jgi:hypothetical protein
MQACAAGQGYLAPKPIILLGEAQILIRHDTRASVCRDPLVQCRHSEAQIIGNLLACQPAGQRDTHRIVAKLVHPFQSHSQSPLLQ